MVAIVQKPAPAFAATAVVESAFKKISLSDYLGKWLVLFFYPLDHTFVCPSEILAFNDALPKFNEINTEVVAVSTDSEYSHLSWVNIPRKQGGLGSDLKLPLLADKNMRISRDYGILVEEEGIALRGSFLIDPKGTLRQMSINDLPVGRSVDETIRLIQAFQFHEAHGEVCPVNWRPGSATIKPDPIAKLEYFSAVEAPTNGHTNGHSNGHAETNGKKKRVANGDVEDMEVDGAKRVKTA